MNRALALVFLLILGGGCDTVGNSLADFDGDNSLDDVDCGPADPTVYPGAPDPYGDDLDQSCDGVDGVDNDRDGYPAEDPDYSPDDPDDMPDWDCVDSNAAVNPGAEEVANNGLDDDCRDGALEDQDGDGFGAVDDCDDNDATVYVGAPELADETDNDCDGDVDEGTAGVDDDGDGYCEGADYQGTGILSCYDGSSPGDCDDTNMSLNQDDGDGDGYSTCGADNLASSGDEDCDDAEANLSPGEVEVCDGTDNDCDGEIDEGSAAPTTWYADADLDGYGDTTSSISGCAETPGYVALDGDCDDNAPAVHPGAVDGCDGLDTDCDGQLSLTETDLDGDGFSPCQLDCDDADPALNPSDADGDGNTTCAGDCDDNDDTVSAEDADSDGFSTCAGDCDDDSSAFNPGATEICDGLDNNCDQSVPAGETDADGDGDLQAPCGSDCDEGDASLNGLDADGDGSSTCQGDCDDGSAVVRPGAAELCDGIDNDCNGFDDAGSPGNAGREIDGDGDGYRLCDNDCDDTDADLNLDDLDLDGHSSCGADCNDGDITIYLFAPEAPCDGIDSNCVPDALEQDDDGDGYLDCTGYTGLVGAILGADDCDDAEAAIFPGNTEVCDGGLDNDCIPSVAPPWDPGITTTPTAESIDVDLDGYPLCGPDGLLGTVDDDCDDNAGWIYPGAPEVCDSLDNDCDGALEVASNDLDADGQTICAGDCNDGDATIFDGATELYDGKDNDCDYETDEGITLDVGTASVVFDGQAWGDQAGHGVAGVGDVDGDNLDDVLIGAPEYDDNGRAYLFLGSSLVGESQLSLASADAIFDGVGYGERAGALVAAAGDVDGDTLADFLISAPDQNSGPGYYSGGVYLIFGSTVVAGLAAGTTVFDLSAADLLFQNVANADDVGCSIASAGDVDGDGRDDVLIGARGVDAAGSGSVQDNTGAAYLVLGSTITGHVAVPGNTVFSLADADATFVGENPGDAAGYAVGAAGDVDGDGFADLLVGAPHWGAVAGNWRGRTYLYRGVTVRHAMAITFGVDTLPLADADMILDAEPNEDDGLFGGAQAGPGDIDGDNLDDLLIGSPSAGESSPWSNGYAYVVLGSSLPPLCSPWPACATQSIISMTGADFVVEGIESYDWASWGLAYAGDVDADGGDDLLIAAPESDYHRGTAYLVSSSQLLASGGSFSLSAAAADLWGSASWDRMGRAVDSAGDVNNDGKADFIVGAYGNDTVDDNAGRAFLLLAP